MRTAQNRVDSVLREVQLSVDLRRVDAREATLAAAGTLAGAPPGEASAEQAAWAGEVSQALEALDREERQSLLHELLDAEMVPASGRGQWAALLRALGGEYAAIAALAPALPTQRRIEEAAQEEEKRRYLAEAEAEEEDE